ncbi:acyl-CoA thioesterase [Yoonia sp. MH D7]
MNRHAYPLIREMQTRWNDNDAFGHMNNAVHYQFFDTMVNGVLRGWGCLQDAQEATRFLVAETGCKYYAEMRYPDCVIAGLRINHLGNSSVCYDLGLFCNDDLTPFAEGRLVHVNVDRQTGRPTSISSDLRRKMDLLKRECDRISHADTDDL